MAKSRGKGGTALWRRRALVLCLVALGALVAVAEAAADAGNPILNTIRATAIDNNDGTVTISVRGQWVWTSHKSDCNTDRAATGVGIIWNDPTEPGFVVSKGAISAEVGIKTLRPGDTVNKVDRMVHPVDRGNVPEGYTTPGVDYPASQVIVDPSPPNPASFAAWKGGCGRIPLDATASKGSHPEKTGKSCGDGSNICSDRPWGSWGYEKTYSHTYLKTALPTQICANFYDVHGGGDVGKSSFQEVKAEKEITVDENGDNSIETNTFDVNQGANCISTPTGTIELKKQFVGAPANARANLAIKQGGTNLVVGSKTDAASGEGTGVLTVLAGSYDISETAGSNTNFADYGSDVSCTGGTLSGVSGDKRSGSVSVGANQHVVCTFTNTPGKKTPTLTTNAGGPYEVGANGTVGLTDTATLHGATSDATGVVTFRLYGPDATPAVATADDCDPGKLLGTATATVSGGTAGPSAPAIPVGPGTYHWTASYAGDAKNNGATSPCGAENENPVVSSPPPSRNPAIDVEKTTSTPVIISGGTALFTIRVENTGDVTLTNVRITDPLAPGCARTSADVPALASMAPGAVVTYPCSRANVTADFTNIVVATGTPPTGPDVSEADSVPVDVIRPAIEITKTTSTPLVVSGGTAMFTIRVENTGDVTLTNVHVTDAQAPGCAKTSADVAGLPVMVPGAVVTYACSKANVTSDFTNVAVATGTPPVGPDVSDSDSAPVDVVRPAIAITKTTSTPVVVSGGTASFTIRVENTGDVTLTNVIVTDTLAPGCARTSATLPALATMIPGAVVTYGCSRANVTADFTNVAVATGTPPVGPDVTDTDSVAVDVTGPSIKVTKTTSTPVVVSGGTAMFTIRVENTGDVTLTNVHVTDALAPGCAKTSADVAGLSSLVPGAVVTYACSRANVTADFTNVAVATGTPPAGPDVTDSSSVPVDVVHPAIKITKTTSTPLVASGGTAMFTITVENIGDVTLTNVFITDALAPNCAKTSADIAGLPVMIPGAVVAYACSKANVTSDFTNVAVATGTPPVGPDVTATSSVPVDVVHPAIKVTKTTSTPLVVSGGTALFTITVENTGDVTLANVIVTDALAPGCARTSATLAALASLIPGAVVTYACSRSNVTSDFTNVAVATGTPPAGPDVTSTSSVPVDVVHPALKVTKTTSTPLVVSGGTAMFTITVENTGDVALTNVNVTDAMAPGCAKTSADVAGLPFMLPGAVVTYACSKANVTADFTNTAVATGTPPVGPDVTDTSSVPVDVVHPAIKVTKTTSTPTLVSGGTALFTITVENTGDVTLTNVVVTDALAPGCARTSATLGALASLIPGAVVSYSCSRANVTADFTNVAVATGTPPVGPDVTNTSSVSVDVVGPSLKITKTTSTPVIVSGGTAQFTITVENTGDVTLTNVVVTDALAPGCARTSATLPALATMVPGAVVSYTCSLANVTADLTNVAVVTGTPPTGPDVGDTSSTPVDVIHPSISIEKTPDAQTVVSGSSATFTITVTNTGDVTLTNVVVTDALAPGCARTSATLPALASLVPGAVVSYTCSLANVTAGFTNVAVVTGTPPVGSSVSDGDEAVVTVVPPTTPPAVVPPSPADIAIQKDATAQVILVNGQATIVYDLRVQNNGPGAAASVTVTDTAPAGVRFTGVTLPPAQGSCSISADGLVLTCAIGTLAAGQSVSIRVNATVTVNGTITNIAVALTSTPDSNPGNNNDSAQTLVVAPVVPPKPPAPTPKPGVCRVQVKPIVVQGTGKRQRLTVTVLQGTKGVRATVRITGAGVRRTVRTGSNGKATLTILPRAIGVITVAVVDRKNCTSARVGVVGTFKPPVTG